MNSKDFKANYNIEKGRAVVKDRPLVVDYPIKPKKPKQRTEHHFETAFANLSEYMGCQYVKTPDYVVTGQTRHIPKRKLPCDGVLASNCGNYFLEFKIGNAKLKPHQANWQRKINAINKGFYVVRRITETHYRLEQDNEIILTTPSIKGLVEYFIAERLK
jgi:hypothetical protein